MVIKQALDKKRILVGITGGIAAYKSIELIRQLRKLGAEVRVVLTHSSQQFVSALTLQAISGNAVADSLFDLQAELAMGHIELAKWAELIIAAPATANFIASLNLGLANDLLTTICLATTAPIFIAPAMNQQMYKQITVQSHLDQLRQRGIIQIGPNSGEQACGDVGLGRMVEPTEIASQLTDFFHSKQDLSSINVLITAGPTHEAIDPVRFIGNHSSGKMGFAIAESFAKRGAQVTLISGPTHLNTDAKVNRINVISAQQMFAAVMDVVKNYDIFIGCAAVADYRVKEVAPQKIKKMDDELTINLVKNPDIISQVGHLSEHRPFTVGFAAETQNLHNHAQNKLRHKKLDMICANDVSSTKQGFNSEQNALDIFWQDGHCKLSLKHKQLLADELIDKIIEHYKMKIRAEYNETN